ncbi:hypothetical protein C0Q70_16379 [Pomacea canaliculata]|uniref:Ig-like domain-containing protein n=1 Tax=Pomacea canaliculata TaxID=400727 RepID=A0A2T7NPN3_POMCA|nr:muscle, skeletal receptor tyrosine-protein kinase-like isoform X2 [Pomacea canaliculata]PVD23116.1 hypothetical protein C0Q70_16379 [Pomacea canaliculata]
MATGWSGRALGAGVLVPMCMVLVFWPSLVATELRLTTAPRNQTVMNNKRLRLPCRAQGSEQPVRVQWYHDNKPMYKQGRNYRISERTGTLRFTEVQVVDRGIYRCKVWNDFEEVYSDPVQLSVHAEAEIISNPQRYMWETFGLLATLTCEAAGIPLPSIQWRINGTSVTAQDFLLYGIDKIVDKETSPVTRRSVIFVNATVSAEFECEAVNKHIEGTTAVTKKTYLYVKPPNAKQPSIVRWQGLCKPYNGSVCRDQLGFSTVYHNLTRRDDDDDDDYVNGQHHQQLQRRRLCERAREHRAGAAGGDARGGGVHDEGGHPGHLLPRARPRTPVSLRLPRLSSSLNWG